MQPIKFDLGQDIGKKAEVAINTLLDLIKAGRGLALLASGGKDTNDGKLCPNSTLAKSELAPKRSDLGRNRTSTHTSIFIFRSFNMNAKTSANLPADPEGMNDERAEWAQTALDAFARETGQDKSGDDDQTILTDLVGDFMHWCDRNGVDFAVVLHGAQVHYAEETKAE